MANTNRRSFFGKLSDLLGLSVLAPTAFAAAVSEPCVDDVLNLGPCRPDWFRATCAVTDGEGNVTSSVIYLRQTLRQT